MTTAVHPETVRYAIPTWGVGELTFLGGLPVAHDLPSRRRAPLEGPVPPRHERLLEQIRRYFAGARESFADVDLEPTIELWGLTPFEAAVTRALQRVPWGTTLSYGALAAAAGRGRPVRPGASAPAACSA